MLRLSWLCQTYRLQGSAMRCVYSVRLWTSTTSTTNTAQPTYLLVSHALAHPSRTPRASSSSLTWEPASKASLVPGDAAPIKL